MKLIKESTRNFWKLQDEGAWGIQKILNMIHAYMLLTLYDHYVTSALVLIRFLGRLPKWVYQTVAIDFFANRYHCKVLTYENAAKLVALDTPVVVPPEESKRIVPWDIANKLILNNKDNLAIVDCPCRLEKKTAGRPYCEPIHTCIFMGKVSTDFVTSHMPRMHGKRATTEEVLDLLKEQHERGMVFSLWFKDATGYRGGVLCCCCSCCCAGMEVEMLSRKKGIEGLKLTAPSGYSVKADRQQCDLCGTCSDKCPYQAWQITGTNGNRKLVYNYDLCMGCGVCVAQCPHDALSLQADPEKGVIFDVDAMARKSQTIHSESEVSHVR